MELNEYQNSDELRHDQQKSDGGEQEVSKPERDGKSAAPVRGIWSPFISFILPGLSILLSLVVLSTVVILFSQHFREVKMPDANFKPHHSQLKSNVTRLSEEVRSLLAEHKSQMSKQKENPPQVQCPDQWRRFQQNCYYFSLVTKNYTDAQRSCTSMHANLVVINSAEEKVFLQHWTHKGSHWIGLSDSISEGDWRWVDGTDYASSVKFWSPNEPNNRYNVEDCAELLVYGEWNDAPCNFHRYWICEKSA
ncbi:asialoglycoprotein receptor 1-like [Scyliorhinus torazame]|uniref:asialoglycoprotein receptor 1-like n=1 Tax=Scyliorhinus torazame TaxID=75743 RepID=UPI003B5B690B